MHVDCRHFTGSVPCGFHKLDGRSCDGCGDYERAAIRILIVKLAAAGDVLRTTCILPALRAANPGAEITWITERGAMPLLEENPLIDRIVARDAAVERLLVERFDLVLGLDPDEQGASLAALARGRDRAGYVLDDRGRVMPVNEAAAHWWRMGLDDAVKRANRRTYQELLYAVCGLRAPVSRPQIVVPPSTTHAIRERFRRDLSGFDRVCLLNTGGGSRWQQKKWTPAHYAGFASLMRRHQPQTAVVVAGGPEEAALNSEVVATVAEPGVVDGGCAHSIKEFAALVQLADLVVTSDSLALHVAAALSRPVVALVGPTSPWELEMYGTGEVVTGSVPCLACYRRQCDKPVTCMDLLLPERVYAACARVTRHQSPVDECQLPVASRPLAVGSSRPAFSSSELSVPSSQ